MTQYHSSDARLLSIREAAALIFPDEGSAGIRRLRNWVDDGFLPSVQRTPRGKHFIHADDLRALANGK